jgi:diguanylate cyclase (GGDEF)-like protein/PAS domain S-box-containing protein
MAERDGFKDGEEKYWAAAEDHVNLMLALQESQEKLQIIIDTALDAVVLMDAKGVITGWNKHAESIFGWPREEAVGRVLHETIIPLRYRNAHLCGIERFLAAGEGRFLNSRIDITAQHRDGHEFPVELSIVPIKMADKYEFSAFIRDISERKQMEEQVHHLAFYDTLTKLPNRRLLNDRLNQSMSASKRSGCYCALMFIDLDDFKPLNDTHGHGVGDLLLVEVADRLKSCVREMDTVARFGGDEFVVVLSDLNADKAESTTQAEAVAEKIRIALSAPYLLIVKHEGKADTTVEHHCTASIGVVLFFSQEVSAEGVLKSADMAMYQAKEAGGNQIRYCDANT